MNATNKLCLCLVAGFFAPYAQAKTASEVFEEASRSVVVVYGLDANGKKQSQGSGVVMSSREVATNCHVLKDGTNFSITYLEQAYPAKVRHSDWDRDVCSLTVPGLHARPASLVATRSLKVGQRVYAIGAPQGLELTLSEGIVSSLREVDGGRYIQTTAPISPGSSGGGLFDEEGRLVGLPTFYLAEGQQLNFALPVEWVKALPVRHTTWAHAGQNETAWLNKAIALEGKEDWPTLLEHAKRWTKAQPRSSTAWYSLGNAYDYSGQTAKAIEVYQQALRINPEYAEAWNNIGFAYGRLDQNAKAIEAFQQALRINPGNAMAWSNLGGIYVKTDKTAKAIEALHHSLRNNPENAKAWNNLASAYAVAGQTAKAIEALQQALRINPEYASAWYQLGIIYKMQGQLSRVMEVHRRLTVLSPVLADKFFSMIVLP